MMVVGDFPPKAVRVMTPQYEFIGFPNFFFSFFFSGWELLTEVSEFLMKTVYAHF